jgi:hypothetical protein
MPICASDTTASIESATAFLVSSELDFGNAEVWIDQSVGMRDPSAGDRWRRFADHGRAPVAFRFRVVRLRPSRLVVAMSADLLLHRP